MTAARTAITACVEVGVPAEPAWAAMTYWVGQGERMIDVSQPPLRCEVAHTGRFAGRMR